MRVTLSKRMANGKQDNKAIVGFRTVRHRDPATRACIGGRSASNKKTRFCHFGVIAL
jgi:hypothetical protein